MNSPALKTLPQVNLEEFERRLRAAGSQQAKHEDPLAVLARLVGSGEGSQGATDKIVALAPARMPKAPTFENAAAPAREPLLRVHFGEPEAAETPEPAPFALRPTLRGQEEPAQSFDANEHQAAPAPAEEAHYDQGQAHEAFEEQLVALAAQPETGARPTFRWRLKLALLTTVGIAGLIGAFAYKGGAFPSLHKSPPVIMADSGPTKIQPPSQEAAASPGDSASVLLKDQPAKPAPVKIVTKEEQPVDLRQQAPTAPPVAAVSPTGAPVAGATSPAPSQQPSPTAAASAHSVSPIAPAPTTPVIAPPNAVEATPPGTSVFPEAKPVKTVSVRPDGTVISSATGQAPSPAQTAAPKAPAHMTIDSLAATAALPATPKLDLPTKPAAKSTARVPVAKIETTAAPAASQSPEAALQTTLPTKLEKAAKSARNKNAQIAAATDPAPAPASAAPAASGPATSAGVYSVQLAAPGSESEAQSAASRLKGKYSSELSGKEPAIHKADVGGRAVYRVRVGGLSQADAAALCAKIKANGGDAACFVAKN